jgi:nanoRNase/pAp phosphatase (c-di-AMP/oligoRNAs hydrolase)
LEYDSREKQYHRLGQFVSGIIANKTGSPFSIISFTHRQADPDALCSAKGFEEIVRNLANSRSLDVISTIVAPGGSSLLAMNVCKKLGIQFVEKISGEELSRADLIAVLDVGEPALLGEMSQEVQSARAPKVVIDHHRKNDLGSEQNWNRFDVVIVRPDSTSTSEVIAQEFDQEFINQDTASVLLVGILFDSQHLGIATESTLKAALILVQKGAIIEEAKSVLRGQPERSEVIARLKSAQRLKFVELGGYLMARTEVSSFHASVARMLVEIGADFGIAYGESDGESRVSLRSSQRFFRETAVDLGTILGNLARDLKITGGGHSTAASISGKAESAMIVEDIIRRVTESLPKKW